jgi:hypothetical protein
MTRVVGVSDEYMTPLVVADQESRLRDEKLVYEVRRHDGGHSLDEDVLRELAAPG